MFHALSAAVIAVPAGFKDIVKADDVRLHIHVRAVNGIPHTRLRRKVYDDIGMITGKQPVHQRFIRNGPPHEFPLSGRRRCLQPPKPVFLERRVIIIVDVIHSHDQSVRGFLKKPLGQRRADKSGGAGHKDGFTVETHIQRNHFFSSRINYKYPL